MKTVKKNVDIFNNKKIFWIFVITTRTW